MASHGVPKMSLVAQYDDLCRYTKTLTTGCEEEFRIFVENQQLNQKRWRDSEKEIKKLKLQVINLESEKKNMETKNKHLKYSLEMEIERRIRIEQDKNSMERQIALVKEVLLADRNVMDDQTKEKLAFLSTMSFKHNDVSPSRLTTIEESVGSLLSLSDTDKTDDDIDTDAPMTYPRRSRRSKGKRGNTHVEISPKRKKSSEYCVTENNNFAEQIAKKSYTLPPGIGPSANTRSNRCNSEPMPEFGTVPTPQRFPLRSDPSQVQITPQDITVLRGDNNNTLNTPVGRQSLGGKLGRMHSFSTKTIIRPENCFHCNLRINFCKTALKCADCRITCHTDCRDLVALPCVPAKCTPTQKNVTGTISDYTSTSSPMIPALVVHCINEVEARGLKEVGLYRISGSEREVRELKEKILRGRHVPTLVQNDIHAVCGTLKEFLRSLKEPLITRALWKTFVESAEMGNLKESLNAVSDAVCDLPQPNKDTLAFLVLHLQKVALSPDCKMTIDNLSKIFGPTIVGYSQADPSDGNMLSETKFQHKVMHRILTIPGEWWQNLMNVEPDVFNTIPKTPEITPAPEGNFLGPIGGSVQKSKSTRVVKTTLPPRYGRTGYQKPAKRQFFSSPLLK